MTGASKARQHVASLPQQMAARGGALALAWEDEQHDWAAVAAFTHSLAAVLDRMGVGPGARVALLARNRPAHAAALMALVASGRCAVLASPFQGIERCRADLAGCAAVIGDAQDLAQLAEGAPASRLGELAGDAVPQLAGDLAALALPALRDAGPVPAHDGRVLEVSTSGTTGTPKRIGFDAVAIVGSAANTSDLIDEVAGPPPPGELPSPMVMFYPLANISGMGFVVDALISGRALVLLDKFEVGAWRAAVARWPQRMLFLPPAAIRMLLAQGISRADVPQVRAVRIGSAPLEQRAREQFEAALGVPVMEHYGASEFCGIVASIPLALYPQTRTTRRGTVGRARQGVQLRVVDPDGGAPLEPNRQGLLEVQTDRMGTGWIRTTDLARIDAEGFVYLEGRSDAAINRGGFKIVPDVIENALREHAAVHDAAAIGWPDARLGEVPVAAVELRAGATAASEDELLQFARTRLIAYQVPQRIHVLPVLPRTPSLKVDRGSLRRVLGEQRGS